MYNKTEKIVMWLSTFEFMSYKKARFILNNFVDLEEFFDNLSEYKNELSTCFEKDEINELLKERSLSYIERVIKEYDKLDIIVVTLRSKEYPKLLREIDSPPIMLYCKGNISLLNSECLGVVGTRRATRYGKENCSKIVKDIATEGVTIVSGLAEGIDTVAHKACLEVNGKTIAVLGGGFLNMYPASNINLAEDIIDKGGLLITEYKPSEPAVNFHFPIRNRIIAGLSKAIFIAEATEKSGSMHTKNFALDYGREVFALPGRITDIYSVGCNKSIKNGQARMLLSTQEIIDFFGRNKTLSDSGKVFQLTCEEQLIYDCLLGHEKHIDELIKETGLEFKVLQTLLMRMTINKVINKQPNNFYALN